MPHVTEEIWTHLPRRETRLIVAPWPERQTHEADFQSLAEAQTAARIYRRSRVRIELAGDAQRIFEAVVRPTDDGQGDVGAERVRVQKEIERAERMLANEKFVANAAPEAVDAEREKLAQYLAERNALG
jgi:valyl-tRNA synthetase